MIKNKWIVAAITVVSAALVLTIFGVTFKAQTGKDLPWWAYIAALVIFALIVYLVLLLSQRSSKRFETLVLNEGIAKERQYKWGNYLLYVDFDTQRLANNYLSTRAIIPFSEVAGYRFETYRSGEEIELPQEEIFVNLVISLTKEGIDYEYQYLPVFEIRLNADDAADFVEVTAELVEKYPELADMLALEEDVKKILEINKSNGIRSNIHN